MSDLQVGDVVSLSRAQAVLVTVMTDPAAPDEPYTVTLPINGQPTNFTILGQLGQTIDELAAALVAQLQNEQTPYSVALDDSVPWRLMIVGPLGIAFDATTTPNLVAEVAEEAFQARSDDGTPLGLLRVVQAASAVGFPPLQFATRIGGQTVEVDRVVLRELGTGNVLTVDVSSVLTRLP